MRTKKTTRFEQHHCPQHLCDSTVAPPLPFPGHALWLCGGKWGDQDGSATYYLGACCGLPSLAQKPRRLKDNSCDNPSGGGGCLGQLPPCVVMQALHVLAAQQGAAPRRRRKTRPTKDQKRNPKTKKNQRKGLGANPGHKESQNSHSPSTNAFLSFSLALSGSDLHSSHRLRPLGVSCKFAMLRLHFCKCIPYFDVALLQVHSTLFGYCCCQCTAAFHMALWPIWSSQTPIPKLNVAS